MAGETPPSISMVPFNGCSLGVGSDFIRFSASFSSGNPRAIVTEIDVLPDCAVSAPRSIA